MNCISSEHADDLMQEVVELCTKSRATLTSPNLVSSMEGPDKAQSVKQHGSHFKARGDAQ